MLFRNAIAFFPSEGVFRRTDLLVKNGKIAAIGEGQEDEDTFDASGQFLTPGLIEAHSHIGVCEEAVGWEGDDLCENEPVTPEIRAIDPINPFDVAFTEALRGGVTTICTGPGSGGVVAGTFALLENNGAHIVDEMILRADAAMKIAFGENPRDFGRHGKQPNTRASVAFLLRKCLEDARDYQARRAEAAREGKPFKREIGLEQMVRVLDGELPLKAHVHRADDICTAIRIAREYGVRMTLDHCTEGHLIADYVAKAGYPAIVGPSFGSKSKYELRNKSFETVPSLVRAGVLVSITTDHNVHPQESLILFAAMAVKAGLSKADALRCVTLNPAKILGIAEQKGDLRPGMDADLVLWNLDPLDIQSRVVSVLVRGKRVL